MKDRLHNWWDGIKPYAPYGVLTLLIMIPMLLPGYILTLDMVFVPHPPLPEAVTNTYVFDALLHSISYVVPSDVTQKIILFGLLLGAGIGMHRLIRYLRPKELAEYWHWAAYFAGTLYVINPFVYGRLMAGQYKLLLGYAIVPFLVKSLLRFFAMPSARRAMVPAVLTVAISLVSIHVFGFAVILSLIFMAIALWRRHTKTYMAAVAKYAGLGIGSILLLSSYWLVPPIFSQGGIAGSVNSFTAADFEAFATDGGLFSVLQLKGFWAEAQGLFMQASDPLPLSGMWQLLLWGLVGIGVTSAWKYQRVVAIAFGAMGLIAIALSIGGPIVAWLAAHMPFFGGYREPHKFVALLVLAYAYFGAFGTATVLLLINTKRLRAAALGAVAVLLLLNTPTLLWGCWGQLRPVHYPADWYTMRQEVQQLSSGQVLFLPWHLYMQFDFTGRIIANPAEKFFSNRVIGGNDPEFDGSSSGSANPAKTALNELLPNAAQQTSLGGQLEPLGVQYVLFAKDVDDDSDYGYLDQQTDMHQVRETDTLKLYEVNTKGAENAATQ